MNESSTVGKKQIIQKKKSHTKKEKRKKSKLDSKQLFTFLVSIHFQRLIIVCQFCQFGFTTFKISKATKIEWKKIFWEIYTINLMYTGLQNSKTKPKTKFSKTKFAEFCQRCCALSWLIIIIVIIIIVVILIIAIVILLVIITINNDNDVGHILYMVWMNEIFN